MNYEQEIKKLETRIEKAEAQIKELKAEAEADQGLRTQKDVIEEYKSQLEWYLTEYLPSINQKEKSTMRHETEDRIKQLQAEIDQLRANQEAPPVWEPEKGEVYYVADDDGVSKYGWRDDGVDKYFLKVGNLFKTEQEAENYARALELIETIRRERYKAQGNWWPSEGEVICTMCWDQSDNYVDTDYASGTFSSDVFGLWRYSDLLRDVIRKYESELEWYFTEYLPSIY